MGAGSIMVLGRRRLMNRDEAAVLDRRVCVVSTETRARVVESRLAIASALCLVAAAQIEFEDFAAAELVFRKGRAATHSARILAEAKRIVMIDISDDQ